MHNVNILISAFGGFHHPILFQLWRSILGQFCQKSTQKLVLVDFSQNSCSIITLKVLAEEYYEHSLIEWILQNVVTFFLENNVCICSKPGFQE